MKPLVTLMLICMLLSKDLQPSAALSCYDSGKSSCNAVTCDAGQDRCYTASDEPTEPSLFIRFAVRTDYNCEGMYNQCSVYCRSSYRENDLL
ncbi:hypothetical protein NFI96_027546 [Prochilodus magdalenae]|nr:hypothetical protein NFI96_027546 [Prochilodus magdalenae]